MTLSELRRDIRVWIQSSSPEFLESINSFIRQAEELIVSSVKLPDQIVTYPTTFAGSSPLVDAPPGMRSISSIYIDGYGILEKKDASFIREVYPSSSLTGQVRFYAQRDDKKILLGPTPDSDVTATIEYTSKPASLVDTDVVQKDSETYISQNWGTALTQGCLMFGSIFIKDPEMEAIHMNLFAQSIGLSKDFVAGMLNKQKAEKSNAAVTSEGL